MPKHHKTFSAAAFEALINKQQAEFAQTLQQLNHALNASLIFLASIDRRGKVARSCIALKHNRQVENFTYSLQHTPCEDALDDSSCLILNDVCSVYPKDVLLQELNIASYLGYPIRCEGKAVGLLVALTEHSDNSFSANRYIADIFVSQLNARLESQWRLEQLRSAKQLLDEVSSLSDIGAWEYDVASKSLYWSDEVYQIYGIEAGTSITPEFAIAFFEQHERERLRNLFNAALENGADYIADFRFVDNFGRKKWIRTNGKVEKSAEGKPKRLYGAIQDVTQERKSLETERATATYLRGVLDSLNDAVITIDAAGTIVNLNRRAESMFGYHEQELAGQRINMLMPEPYASNHDSYMKHYQQTGHAQIMGVGRQLPALRRNGDVFQMELALSEYRYNDEMYYIGIVRDITERIEANDTIYKLAYTDSITGLPNRAAMERDVTDLVNRTAITENYLYFCYVNVDSLTNLNLTYGRHAVNQLLKLLSQRMQGALLNNFSMFKFKVDGFLIVSRHSEPSHNLTGLHYRLLENKLLDPALYELNWQSNTIALSVSVSSMVTKVNAIKLDRVIESLEFGMKKAKRHKPFGQFFLGPVAFEEYERYRAIKRSIHDAVFANEFHLVLQPQFRGPNHVTSSEALLRWTSPTLGVVSPAEFIPIAEESDDIILIGNWVIEQVCMLLQQLTVQGINTRISVNISGRQIVQPNFEKNLMRQVNKYAVSPQAMMLELTETTLVSDIELVKRKMMALTKLGFSFSIDDFGTGYSSLSYIKELPIAELKIDKYFVDGIAQQDGVAATNIVNVVIDMAKALGLEVVAEGVETQAQLSYLIERGCDAIQGYLLSRPLTITDWTTLMSQQKGQTALFCDTITD